MSQIFYNSYLCAIEGAGIDYTKKDIADGCGISRPTLYKAFPKIYIEHRN